MTDPPPPTAVHEGGRLAAADIQMIRLSLGRCKLQEAFSERFYEIFLASDTRIAQMFARADPQRRLGFLRHAVNLAVLYASGKPTGQSGLRRVRASHGSGGMQVDHRFYDLWIDSLVQAIAETDPEFGADLEAAWRRTLAVGVRYLLAQEA